MKRQGGRRMVFRRWYLKAYRDARLRNLVFMGAFHRGVLVGFTFVETRWPGYVQNMRKEFLRYGTKYKEAATSWKVPRPAPEYREPRPTPVGF